MKAIFACALVGFAAEAFAQAALDKDYLTEDRPSSGENAVSSVDALIFKSDGSEIYGQILRPNAAYGKGRPVVVFFHGFAGFTRMDDVAHALCRAGCVVLIPHHRGAWGSQGLYSITNAIGDAVNLVDYVTSPEFTARYGTDPKAVFLSGHSMGGNTVLHAAIRRPQVRGIVMEAPCDVAFCMTSASEAKGRELLVENGLAVLRTAGEDAIYREIVENADWMSFKSAAAKMRGRNVLLATGDYDPVVPLLPIDGFWSALGPVAGAVRVRRTYPADHSFMGVRMAFAADIADFILSVLKR